MPYPPKVNTRYVQSYKSANQNYKGIVSSVLISRDFHYVHFQRLGDLETRFLHNDVICQTNNVVIISLYGSL
jgi:hypothetical protein